MPLHRREHPSSDNTQNGAEPLREQPDRVIPHTDAASAADGAAESGATQHGSASPNTTQGATDAPGGESGVPGTAGAARGPDSAPLGGPDAPAAPQSNSDDSSADFNLLDQLLDLVLVRPDGETQGTDVQTSTLPGSAGDAGAIVITVNYMFMDGGNIANPGRSGSLVVTLPNNATNREPRIILQFILLATRMAYLALVSNALKPKTGVSLDKFNTFALKELGAGSDQVCSICFDQYDPLAVPEIIADLERPTKKRKVSPPPELGAAAAVAATTATASEPQPAQPDAEPETKYLCDHDEEFDHCAMEMPCGHVFGRSCLAHWLKESTSCPLCRLSVADADAPLPRVVPVTYIRFGGTDRPAGDASTEERDAAPSDEPSTNPSLLHRATLLIFNSANRTAPEAPPPPLPERQNADATPRNPSSSPVIDSILNYFQRARARRQRQGGDSPLFASGVSSRRTANGVETVTSDGNPLSDAFEHLTSLTGDFGAGFNSRAEVSTQREQSDQAAGDQTANDQTAQTDQSNEQSNGTEQSNE